MPDQQGAQARAAENGRSVWARLRGAAASPWALSGAASVAAFLALWLIVQPLAGVLRDADATSTVLYFERIVHGQRLEAFVPTTPKPLLTLVYGLTWALTGDWRWLTVLTMLVAAGIVGMAVRLGLRLGGATAAVAVAVGLLAWPDFQLEVAHANSFVWGLALWLIAAVLITADRPRPWAAGTALLLAGLVRTETVWLLGAAVLCAGWSVLAVARGADRSVLKTALPPLLGLLSLPLACLHDWLLTGQPLYWLSVPGGYTALAYPDLEHVSPFRMIAKELVYYRPALALLPLALLGWLLLVRAGRRALSLALACLAGGVLLTLILLGWRAVYISVRYYEEANAVVLLTAAVGIAWLLTRGFELVSKRPVGAGRETPAGRRAAWLSLAPVLVAGVLVLGTVAVDVPQGTLAEPSRLSIDANAALQAHLDDLRPISGRGDRYDRDSARRRIPGDRGPGLSDVRAAVPGQHDFDRDRSAADGARRLGAGLPRRLRRPGARAVGPAHPGRRRVGRHPVRGRPYYSAWEGRAREADAGDRRHGSRLLADSGRRRQLTPGRTATASAPPPLSRAAPARGTARGTAWRRVRRC